MSKFVLALVTCSVILSILIASTNGLNLFKRLTVTTTTLEPPTTKPSLWLENNIPKIAEDCTGHYICKKKVKHGTGRVCVKYCLKSVECEVNLAGVPATINPEWCVELNQDTLEDDDDVSQTGVKPIMQVNMIDFPCQPGYLPDSRGRCREIW